MKDVVHHSTGRRTLLALRGTRASRRLLLAVAIASVAAPLATPVVTSAATPSVSVSPGSGAPGTNLTVSGSGWTGLDTIFVQIGSATFDTDVVCTLTANLSGVISGNQATNNCVVPRVPVGSRTLVAIDQQHMGTVAHGTSFTVTPGLVLTPAGGTAGGSASPGATVSILGAGFAASSTVSGFTFDGAALATSPSSVGTDVNGTFTTTVTFTVPASTAGNHTVVGTDGGGHAGSGVLPTFQPTLALSLTSAAPGTGLTISGDSWPASDTIFVQIGSRTFDTDVVCTLGANVAGEISGNQATNNCTVPNVLGGTQPLVAIDEQQQGVIVIGTFTVKPGLILTPPGGVAGGPTSPGATVTVQGHGFAAGSTVSAFKFDAAALVTTPSSVSTDANGNFTSSVTFSVPASATAGNHTVSGTDGASHTGSAAVLLYKPTLSLSPKTGAPGTGLTVTGKGWPAGETIFVQIGSSTFDNDIVCTLTSDVSTNIAGNQATNNCTVPNVLGGSEPLVAIDEQHQGVLVASTFTVKAGLVLTPAGGATGGPTAPGVTVTVSGHGFAAGSTVSNFKFDSTAVTTTPPSVTTDASGNFPTTVTFTVPATATAGNHTVSATDGSGDTGTAAQVTLKPKVTLSPSSATPGTPVTVTGSGWPASDTVFVQLGSATFDTDVVCTLAANLSGNIAGNQASNNCVVPNVPVGSQPLVAIDVDQRGVVAFGAAYSIKPGLVLTPLHGTAGSAASPGVTVTIQGHGFAPSSTVSGFKFDSSALVTSPSSIATDSNGNFVSTVTFTVPPAATAASHTVSATDTGSNKATATQLVMRPTIVVSPTSGAPGTGLTVSGSGWVASDTVFVQIGSSTFDTDVVCVVTPNLNGDISGNKSTNGCAVPSVPAGSQVLTAIDDQSQGVVANGANFTVTAMFAGHVPAYDGVPRARVTTES